MDEDNPRRDAYRLERVVDDHAIAIAIFYSAGEASIVMSHLGKGYRVMLGDRQVWPDEAHLAVRIQF
ncbi:hypothetical protein [Mesorhizobium sp. 131-3-5]|uniref:hypothetical protein n=1 Tax=Mesorhizobium sp. 131-3-5 TaxID=2744520 RepID=UPI0019256E4E|nr:hypothetical protein [Mesorhizobium sp. 131-3-5]